MVRSSKHIQNSPNPNLNWEAMQTAADMAGVGCDMITYSQTLSGVTSYPDAPIYNARLNECAYRGTARPKSTGSGSETSEEGEDGKGEGHDGSEEGSGSDTSSQLFCYCDVPQALPKPQP